MRHLTAPYAFLFDRTSWAMAASAHARCRLADHVRACLVDDQVILLDLDRNRYLAVSNRHHALAPMIEGWPAADGQMQVFLGADQEEPLISRLSHQGLLTLEPAGHAKEAPLDEPLHSLDADNFCRGRAMGWRRAARLLCSAGVSALWLRNRSLSVIEAALVARRARMAAHPSTQDTERLEEAAAAFLRFRPFLFTTHDRCLHDSLTLVHFLAGEGLSAAWVVGVRTRPFAAHAWVQSAGTVLNDQAEHVRRYRPILVV